MLMRCSGVWVSRESIRPGPERAFEATGDLLTNYKICEKVGLIWLLICLPADVTEHIRMDVQTNIRQVV
jgi:hypothetical protein